MTPDFKGFGELRLRLTHPTIGAFDSIAEVIVHFAKISKH